MIENNTQKSTPENGANRAQIATFFRNWFKPSAAGTIVQHRSNLHGFTVHELTAVHADTVRKRFRSDGLIIHRRINNAVSTMNDLFDGLTRLENTLSTDENHTRENFATNNAALNALLIVRAETVRDMINKLKSTQIEIEKMIQTTNEK